MVTKTSAVTAPKTISVTSQEPDGTSAPSLGVPRRLQQQLLHVTFLESEDQ